MEWISVEDRLPKKYVTVRIWPTFGDDSLMESMDRGSIQDNGWFCGNYGSVYSRDVTHWMPLPSPPDINQGISNLASAKERIRWLSGVPEV